MHLLKRFLKILLEELNKLDNKCEESGELEQPRCPPGQRFYGGDCNSCLGAGKTVFFKKENRWIEEKDCKDSICGETSFIVSTHCGEKSRVPYKECKCGHRVPIP